MHRATYGTLFLLLLAAAPVSSLRAAPVSTLRVMTFNTWVAEGTAAGQHKLAEIIQAAGADIVGLQEMDDGPGRLIAQELGFNYHQQSGGDIQVLSRYPFVGQSTANLGVQIELSPGQDVWLFNAHLAPYPYQPYDLRDGILPKNEAAVIAAANSARGSQVTAYLNDMASAVSSGMPVFLTGDFNEPSHLDWTQAVADATPRPFDLKVQWPTSKRIVDAGMTDSLRAVRPNPVTDMAYTWTPGAPPPNLDPNEVFDRIDIIYHAGLGVTATGASTVGFPDGSPNTDIAVPGYNADHRSVVATFSMPPCSVFGDLNGDCRLDAADWNILRSNQQVDLSGLTIEQAYGKGDLNGDLRNDHADFVLFKGAFEAQHGPGAFEALLATVPEPPSGTMVSILGVAMVLRRRARRGQSSYPRAFTMGASRSKNGAICRS
jgi:endonuclease/exonuclease/phosphatase family metal-dependent hydrolase